MLEEPLIVKWPCLRPAWTPREALAKKHTSLDHVQGQDFLHHAEPHVDVPGNSPSLLSPNLTCEQQQLDKDQIPVPQMPFFFPSLPDISLLWVLPESFWRARRIARVPKILFPPIFSPFIPFLGRGLMSFVVECLLLLTFVAACHLSPRLSWAQAQLSWT